MIEVGAFEVKAHFGELLGKVGHGASYMITKRGKPVAALIPVAELQEKPSKDLMTEVRELRARIQERYGAEEEMTLKEMIEEGRR